jgi:hypothetical protein
MGRSAQSKLNKRIVRSREKDHDLQLGKSAVKQAREAGNHQRAHLTLHEQGLAAAPSRVYANIGGRRSRKEAAQDRELLSKEENDQLEAGVREKARQRRPLNDRQITQLAEDIINAQDPNTPNIKLGKNWARKWRERRDLRTFTSKKLSFERNRALAPETVDGYLFSMRGQFSVRGQML